MCRVPLSPIGVAVTPFSRRLKKPNFLSSLSLFLTFDPVTFQRKNIKILETDDKQYERSENTNTDKMLSAIVQFVKRN